MSLRLDWSISHQSFFSDHQYWRGLSSLFAHANIEHLLSNLFMLAPLSFFLTKYYGAWRTWFSAITGGVLTNIIVISDYHHEVKLLGISGIVFFMWGYWLAMYFMIERRETWIRRIMKASMIYIVLLIPSEFNPQVSYLAHGVGNVLGLLFGLMTYALNHKKLRSYDQWEIIYEPEDFQESASAHFILE